MGATMTSEDTTALGAAELARTMDLLWGTKPAASRGRKPGLTVERIVATAIELADAEGFDGLSMRRVADALGVGTMSLYRYVRSKAELYELMVDAVIAGEQPDLVTGGWRAGLERFARDSFAGYRQHPWLLRTSVRRGPMGPNQTAALEAILAALSGIGLRPGETMAVIELVTGYVRGAAQQILDDAALAARSGLTDEEFWTQFAPLLDTRLDPVRHPMLTSMWQSADVEWVDQFDFGLRRVLDGVEALVESRS
jgi:AcrR family transcriptional regulator